MTAATMSRQIIESVRFIRSRTSLTPSISIVLGSGLGDFAERLTQKIMVKTSMIPCYPRSTVQGHEGRIVIGHLHRVPLLVFQGRVHFYETGDLAAVLYPIRIAHALGAKILIITNAAGGINETLSPEDLMLITDQINLTFQRPMQGLRYGMPNSELYDVRLQELIASVAKRRRILLQRGVYCGVGGPSYETAAEIRMISKIGGDVVGMSTVNEVSCAVRLGMKVAGISCITNLSTGISAARLSHKDVTEVANAVKQKFSELIEGTVRDIG